MEYHTFIDTQKDIHECLDCSRYCDIVDEDDYDSRENQKTTQKQRVFNHMVSFGGINRLQASNELGVLELSARICELQNDGVLINKERTSYYNRFGEKCTGTVYSVAKGQKVDTYA